MAAGVLRAPIITLLTDFGLGDAYVGIMKGVILSLSPDARLVDLSHEVPPQEVLSGAMVLQSAWRYFPPGTIHLAVVDPGVGSSRRALAAAGREQFFVGPDNGLFSLVFAEQAPLMVVSLENPQYFLAKVSATFHGRDIFAPVAAHLSLGVPLTAFGPALSDPVGLDFPAPEFGEEEVDGQIISCDHFGNLISNIPFMSLQSWLRGRSASFRVQWPGYPASGHHLQRCSSRCLTGSGRQPRLPGNCLPPGQRRPGSECRARRPGAGIPDPLQRKVI